MVTTYGVSAAISGQDSSASFGRLFKPSSAARGVIHCPGNASTSLSYLSADFAVVDALTAAGIPVASFPHGVLWGNTTAQGYISNIRTYGQSNWGFASGTVDLLCGSAGAVAGLNWAKANPTLVRRIGLMIPAVDPQDIDTNNRGGFSASIQSAWGGAVPDVSCPAKNTASFTGFPVKIWYSTNDTTISPSTVTTFASALGVTPVSLGAIGHSASTIVPSQVVSFFQ